MNELPDIKTLSTVLTRLTLAGQPSGISVSPEVEHSLKITVVSKLLEFLLKVIPQEEFEVVMTLLNNRDDDLSMLEKGERVIESYPQLQPRLTKYLAENLDAVVEKEGLELSKPEAIKAAILMYGELLSEAGHQIDLAVLTKLAEL